MAGSVVISDDSLNFCSHKRRLSINLQTITVTNRNLVSMASSNVFHLFCQAVTNGPVTQLSEMRKSDSGKTVPLSFLVNHHNLEGDTLLKIAIKREHFDVAEFIVEELKRQIYPQ
jgi:hypothetical protein